MGLRFAPAVQEFVRTLAPEPKRDIRKAIRLLARDPRHPDLDVKVLRADGALRFFRARVRQYRIVYSVKANDVYVWRIVHRSEGYAWLERLDPEDSIA
jgi:mRNA-degrading endonuclease RelE of RelBE toxin-antitoxin system